MSSSLASLVRGRAPEGHVVLLPDFFIDHVVKVHHDFSAFVHKLKSLVQSGGGIYFETIQQITYGGNAANTAVALAALGAKTVLITTVSKLAKMVLEHFAKKLPQLDLSHVKFHDRESLTVALELEEMGKRVNVLLTDPSSIVRFSPDMLTEDDYETMKEAKLVGVFNWNQNKRGTKLASIVFRKAKALNPNVKTYLDPGDPSIKPLTDIKRLIRKVFSPEVLDHLSVNAKEAYAYAKVINPKQARKRRPLQNAKVISKTTGVEVNLHTERMAYVVKEDEVVSEPAFSVREVRRLTGAGDAWNAGNIYGLLINLKPAQRLKLANACAALHVQGLEVSIPAVTRLLEG